jgi:uncharacterized protein YndB with AHSA1/START domain
MTTTAKSAETELVIRRVFDAPRALMFKLWTEREHAVHWWGPKDFTVPHLETDVRPGGAWRACLRSPEGRDYWQHGVFREIVAPERLVFSFIWDDEPDHEMLVTVTFADHSGKTEMTFRQAPFTSVESRDSHVEGWNECFDRLDAYIAQRSAGDAAWA